MNKINKQIRIVLMGIFFLGACHLKAQAEDYPAKMMERQKVLKSLITDSAVTQHFTHNQWRNRNPFNAAMFDNKVLKSVQTTNLVLQGVFLGTDKPSVIINGMVVGLGDVISGDTVFEIKDGQAVLIDDRGRRIVLSLKQPNL